MCNPWDSNDGQWVCHCEICIQMRLAWPETSELWKPMKGHVVNFGLMVQRPPQHSPTPAERG